MRHAHCACKSSGAARRSNAQCAWRVQTVALRAGYKPVTCECSPPPCAAPSCATFTCCNLLVLATRAQQHTDLQVCQQPRTAHESICRLHDTCTGNFDEQTGTLHRSLLYMDFLRLCATCLPSK